MTTPALNGTVTSAAFAQAAGGTRTVAHTVGSLSNGGLEVACAYVDIDPQTFTSVTYNGVAMTAVPSVYIDVQQADGGYNIGGAAYKLENPPAGLFNIVVTSNASAGFGGGLNHCVFAANFDNVHQTTSTGGGATGSSPTAVGSFNVGPITSSTNDIVLSLAISTGGAFADLQGDGTILGTRLVDGSFIDCSSEFQYHTGTNPTPAWTLTNPPTDGGNAQFGFSLKGTGGGGGGSVARGQIIG